VKVLVVDDEPIARRRLVRMIRALDGWEVAGEAEDGLAARRQIAALAPDVVLLDVRMPGLDGLSLVRADGARLPPIIFTTAYAEYAVQAFDAEAVDYLLKPVEPDRLRRALERARRKGAELGAARMERLVSRLRPPEPPPLAARRGDTVYFFDPRQIAALHAEDNYVAFVVRDRKYLLDESMRDLEQRLSDLGFLRVHRGALVNLRRVVSLRAEGGGASLVLSDGRTVAVSRRRLAAVRRRLGLQTARD
jgi:two-component system LytT family response regulator